jgi:adenylylsulfate kinase
MIGSRKRSLMKAVSWRFIATITGAAIVYSLTGEFEDAGKFIILDVILKLMFYYGHERAWTMVEWGTAEEPAADSA